MIEGYKTCARCKETKLLAKFGKSNQKKDGLRPWCKSCHNAANVKWRCNNPTYYKVRAQQNPTRRKAYDKKYLDKNPNYMKSYYTKKKHEFIERVNARRKQTEAATPAWADKIKMRLLYRIAGNLNKLHGYIKYHVDHIVPLKGKNVSGLHVHTNLRIILAADNKTKYNKWMP